MASALISLVVVFKITTFTVMKKLIILGSARSDGETKKLVTQLTAQTGWDVIDLNNYNIYNYDYDHNNRNDDFLPLMRDILPQYDTLILATPVYWYAMSGIMKTFFDRLTDLLTIEKDLGRTLRGKKMAVITSSAEGNLGNDFWIPFKASADYLGMPYIANSHCMEGEDNTARLTVFIEEIGV